MKVTFGEMADRYSITQLKCKYIGDHFIPEKEALLLELVNYVGWCDWVQALGVINENIWQLESDIRKGKEGILGLEEVGRRAIAIRGWNNQRVALKNQANKHYGEGFVEIKADHASQ